MKVLKQLSVLALFIFSLSISAMAQEMSVTGKVTNAETGEPIPDVNIRVKGSTTLWTSSGQDGEYTITVNSGTDVIIYSFVGFEELEVPVNNRTVIDAKLVSTTLDEIVVVGYGTQRKVNLTGSVSTINATKLENRAAPNLSSSLAGLASGMTVRQSSGNPGSESTSIRIRGTGTFSGSYRSPMVIIDGAPGSMDAVNPDDVATVSVLKDAASAAIYGSRAANGVILITTKKGRKGAAPTVSYSAILSSEKPSAKFELLSNYADYMELFNRAQVDMGATATRYPTNVIDAWRTASQNPNGMSEWNIPNWLAYPNTDWMDELFVSSFSHKHDLSVTGGSENSNYHLALGYYDTPGTLENTGLERFNMRVNVESKINKYLTIGTQTFAMRQVKEPGSTNSAFTYLFQTVPGVTPYHNGKYGSPEADEEDVTANNLLKMVNTTGGKNVTTRINTTWYAKVDILEGLSAEGRINYQNYFYNSDTYDKSLDEYSFRTNTIKRAGTTLENARIYHSNSRQYQYTATALLNYNKSIKDHHFSATLGYEQFYYNTKGFGASRVGMMDFSITDITTATDMYEISTSTDNAEQDYAMVSYFGRLNYSYKDRYLFEANFRRDGSSRFSASDRWGTFPSVSAAWRISEEPFFEPVKNIVQELKLRASWGKLGNPSSGYYDWQATYGKTTNSFGGKIYNGLAVSKIANNALKWENINSTDIALEASFLQRRLTFEAGYYNKLTEGILTSPSIYLTMGTVTPPTRNTSDMRNSGIEITLGWRDQIGDFNYSVNANFSYNKNKIVKYLGKMVEEWDGSTYVSNIGDAASLDGNNIRTEGHEIDEYFMRTLYSGTGTYKDGNGAVDPNGGPRDGMIRTPEDLQWARDMLAAGYTFNGYSVSQSGLWYGEYIMADVNGDKNYGNNYDRQFTDKSSSPTCGFGLSLSAEWKGIDVSMTWAGNAGMHYYLYSRGLNTSNVSDREVLPSDAASKFYFYNEANPGDPRNNINAEYPRLKYSSNGAYMANNRYLYNASYIKLKNLQIGYTIPKKWTEKAYISNLRVFISGENLLTITSFPGLDPEIGGGLNVYPISRVLSAGIKITF